MLMLRSLANRFRLPLFALAGALLITLGGRSLLALSRAAAPEGAHAVKGDHPHAPDAHGHEGAKKHDDHKAEAHKEPSALDHVLDTQDWHFFDTLWPGHVHLPTIPLPFGMQFRITKFMVLELIAALLVIAVYVPLARRVRLGEPPSGPVDNFFEVLLTFVREQIAKPNIGEPTADRYVPFLWTLFLFILFNNLLGMVPFLGSATASITVTGALALIVFFAIHGSAMYEMGLRGDHHHGHEHGHGDHGHDNHGHVAADDPHLAGAAPLTWTAAFQRGSGRYVGTLWPHIDVPIPVMGFCIKLLVFIIEVVGVLVRNGVLAVRLFANMFAGHMVLATILLFIRMAAHLHPGLWGSITFASVLGIVALSLLELFVAFLQAYIFTFLTSLFMGMAINPQH